jgi:hypothetical protein
MHRSRKRQYAVTKRDTYSKLIVLDPDPHWIFIQYLPVFRSRSTLQMWIQIKLSSSKQILGHVSEASGLLADKNEQSSKIL